MAARTGSVPSLSRRGTFWKACTIKTKTLALGKLGGLKGPTFEPPPKGGSISFCYAKAKNVPADKQGQFGLGDVWTWTAIDAETKLVPSWPVGPRDASAAYTFISDLASRLRHRVQLTTDGFRPYLSAVEDAFGAEIDYAVLQKLYGRNPENETRYSPAPWATRPEPRRIHRAGRWTTPRSVVAMRTRLPWQPSNVSQVHIPTSEHSSWLRVGSQPVTYS